MHKMFLLTVCSLRLQTGLQTVNTEEFILLVKEDTNNTFVL